ncbi:MAG TPA: phosphate ABC transporter permease PstA [Rhodospirillales bacterium]
MARLAERNRAERRFRLFAQVSVYVGLVFLAVLFASIIVAGAGTFKKTAIRLDVTVAMPAAGADRRADIDAGGLIKETLWRAFPDVTSRRDRRELYGLFSVGASYELRGRILADPATVGRTVPVWLTASDEVALVVQGKVSRDAPVEVRRLTSRQLDWLEVLEQQGRVEMRFNDIFFTSGDSREPELAGIAGATLGSLMSVMVCLALAFPLGVMAAVYLEEFAPRNRWTEFVEININNLAAVPSIVFGLLGLAVFLNVFHMPRSAPLVGGVVLALMTLPTIIIAGRAAVKAVPPSIREAALALGASRVQMAFHHVLPLAMPGVLTGTIIGTARALGETAPLLMIGMVAFVVDIPHSILQPATALPVQVFLWADSPERAFEERAAAAIIVLLAFTCLMNLAAVILRKKFEVRW